MASMTTPAPARTPGAGARPVVRLTRRGKRLLRTAVAALALLVTVVVLAISSGAVSAAGSGAAAPATRQVVVQPGQTLWGIAGEAMPTVNSREAAQRIAALNGLAPGAEIVPGQPLLLPAG
ncbi:MAG TPA: LysM domain-containing protein [Candidatus Nanopelagicales bacterium]|jgi:LysM repeat protein|nr:LysM domain-containing protein [Candidatus Nanopelagicales bacterium]